MKRILYTTLPFFLISCSALKFGYKMIDWYLSSSISSKYDLYLRQSEKLSEDIDVFLNSRINDFNAAEKFLDLLGTTIEKKELKNISKLQEKGQEIYVGVASDFNQILIKYFLILNDSQKKHLKKELQKENKEIEKKISKQSHNNFSEGLEYLLDDLTDEQKKILEKYQSTFKLSQELRLKARMRLHEIMFKDKVTQEILTDTFDKYVNKELIYQKEFKAVDKAYHDLFTQILKTVTKEQITYSKEAIKDAKKRIKELKKEKF